LIKRDFVSNNLQVFIQPDFEVRRVGVALAGHAHIGHAVEHQLHRLFGDESPQRRQGAPGRGLVFLAAKAAAQARYVYFYLVHAHAQHVRRVALHGRRALRGGDDAHAAHFGGESIGALRFDVQMLLPAALGHAFKHMRALSPGSRRITHLEGARRYNQLALRGCYPRVGNNR
jgi:hypothetical protein